ncbi:3-methyl-2-oxobutanoate hydroxymethyltransferase [Sporomusaceae bacterium FL31]|nr:3-methyl-2-oxobutanoate hydroxymethyltransferase [Sporomusaceae bacterium FL31]GCE32250.1 3-methyl-2-oxobutanoate hydroxymethyltransferase [Sporomusaceae bacterium]
MKKKLTIPQFKELKAQGKKFRMVTAYDYTFASIVEKTPIEMILVGDSLGMVVLGYDSTVPVTMEDMLHHIKPVVRGARNTFVVGDMPFGSYNVSVSEAIRNANRIIQEGGADAVKLEGGSNVLDIVSEMVKGGIPVVGHIGLTPQTATQLGGFKVQGKDTEIARKLVEDALHLEQAGAFALVLECVVAPIAQLITEKVAIPTIGIGAGPACDAQVLVMQDLLGMYDKFTPKFVKQYAQLNGQIVEALNSYAQEVADGVFPGPEHTFGLNKDQLGRIY